MMPPVVVSKPSLNVAGLKCSALTATIVISNPALIVSKIVVTES
jgi:hypothetical protein